MGGIRTRSRGTVFFRGTLSPLRTRLLARVSLPDVPSLRARAYIRDGTLPAMANIFVPVADKCSPQLPRPVVQRMLNISSVITSFASAETEPTSTLPIVQPRFRWMVHRFSTTPLQVRHRPRLEVCYGCADQASGLKHSPILPSPTPCRFTAMAIKLCRPRMRN